MPRSDLLHVVGVPSCSPERHGQTCRGSYEVASAWSGAAVGRRAALRLLWHVWRCSFVWLVAWQGGVAAAATTVAAAHAVARGVGMFGYSEGQGLDRGLKVKGGGGSGECSGVCLYAGTAELPGQGVTGAVAEAAAVTEGKGRKEDWSGLRQPRGHFGGPAANEGRCWLVVVLWAQVGWTRVGQARGA